MKQNRRPNFLVFVADQLRADHLGFGGNAIVRTPNLDALAARSARFERAFVASPICMPNRASVVTGRMPSAHGTRVNGIPLAPDVNTIMHLLRAHGWATAAVGKLHFQNMGWEFESGQLDAFLAAGRSGEAERERGEPDWADYEDMQRHLSEWVELPSDYYGFDAVDLVVGHSDYAGGHYAQWLRRAGVDPVADRGRRRARRAYQGWKQVYESPLAEELYPTRFVTDHTTARLEKLAAGSQPFFLFCSYPDPHHPFTPPRRLYDMYDPREMAVPATFDDPHLRSMPHFAAMAARRGVPDEDPTVTWAIGREQLRHAMAAEYGMITLLDESVGEILGVLDRLGQAEDTVVLFTSDHGDMFGDHGLMLKHFTHYEGCVRVPLTVSAPGCLPGARAQLASSTDIAATVLDLAGLRPYHGMHGRSLVPALSDPGASGREQLLIEEDQVFGIDGLPGPVRMRTVITDHARMTTYDTVPAGELYDLRADPQELHNLHGDPEGAALRAEMAERLAAELVAVADTGRTPRKAA